ncbi:MAG TPA: bacteriohemerythrin [Spirochaetota bacterium]|nr:bacteriohemerythrin [Spirochaetota bacterium]HOL57545.1 bacteriohemerythrin [Spirochaetota bacterium]HPP05071.1 bacteriohemerythrin [Spirochaetota bacterium]
MSLFIWEEKYSVNIKEIDEQHKKLVGILNELHTSMLGGKANNVLKKVLNELIDYTTYHFKTEEQLMTIHNYPKYDEHKASHKNLTDKVLSFYSELESGKKLLSVELLFFLKDWLVNHILGEDKMYSKFFNDKGIF